MFVRGKTLLAVEYFTCPKMKISSFQLKTLAVFSCDSYNAFPTAKCILLSDGLGISPLRLVVGFVLFLQSENIIKQLNKNYASDTELDTFSMQNYKFLHYYIIKTIERIICPVFTTVRRIFRKAVVLDS